MSRRLRLPIILVSLLLALSLAGCGAVRSADRPVSLVVSTASDLRFASEELGRAFERETGVRVEFNFGSSGKLARQIEQGAPVDVFASANVSFVDDLARKGRIIPDSVALYARGRIVLWWRDDAPLNLQGLEDLARPEVRRVAIANPDHAPYGIAARQALQRAGLWDRIRPKLVPGESVAQALQYARTGNVDVAIVALSLALSPGVIGGRYLPVPEGLHDPIDQAIGVVASTRHEREAREFVAFVIGPEGRAILKRYGFTLPREAGP